MYFCFMIVVTGAAGFIGSCLVSKLNSLEFENLILVDDFSSTEKNKNLEDKQYLPATNTDIIRRVMNNLIHSGDICG